MRIMIAAMLLTGLAYAKGDGKVVRPIDKVDYYDHEDVYTEILDFEAKTGHKVAMNIEICIDGDCEMFYHIGPEATLHGTIHLKKKQKATSGGKGSGIQPILNAIGKGVAVGAKLQLKGLKVNPDGSFTLEELTMWGGAAMGTDVPVPGEEGGKQVHHH